MVEKIQELEHAARLLEPSGSQRNHLNQMVQAYADEFIENIEVAKAFHVEEENGLNILNYNVADEPRSIEELIQVIRENIDLPALNPASGGHLAYIPGGGLFPTALGDYLAAITNRYAGIFFASPGAVRMENMLVRWMCKIIGYPETALGNLTSGGSIANLMAITTAREHLKLKARNIENAVIYLTQQVHHSIQKAIRIAGLSEAKLSYVPVDDRFRMDMDSLKKLIKIDRQNGLKPFMLIGSAGTTDTGAVDPMEQMAEIAGQHGMWFHVDAAYGGFFVLSDEVKHRFKGIEKSDSITIDPHKGLFLSYGTGAFLVKNVEALQNVHFYKANYMQDVVDDASEPSPADLSPELTKHFRGLRMWLPLQLFGLKPFRAALDEKIWLCRYFYQEIQKLGYEVGPEPELSVMIYRYVPKTGDANAFNAKLVEMVREDGRVFLSSTTIVDVFWIRLAVLCFRTHMRTIQTCLEVLKKSVDTLKNSPS